MPVKIVRNDITKMTTEAVVNTANEFPQVGPGVDRAIYNVAGMKELLAVRKEIGRVDEGEAFITSGFKLHAKYIIHTVSPMYIDGESGEEEKLRDCYRNALSIAVENRITSLSFPLIATGSFEYPLADGLRIAMEEINKFLLYHDLEVYVVVFNNKATSLASRLQPQLESYIDENYVENHNKLDHLFTISRNIDDSRRSRIYYDTDNNEDALETFQGEKALDDVIAHLTDPFGVYFFYLVDQKGLSSSEVQNRAWITKQVYSKINKNRETYHPDKRTALQLSIALELTVDETKDFLARAGYAFSTSDKQDLIFRFFIENEWFDIIDISDALEKYGLKPILDF